MLVAPISFVTEHIETLHEINIEARLDAKKAGIEMFRMMPAVGDSPIFIEALKELVLQAAGVEVPPKGFAPLAAQAPNSFVN
jgi:ferrochelatase